ncbi:MAG: hypothetical protein QW666_02015 [Candidatus Woesearchaeota archaeon]
MNKNLLLDLNDSDNYAISVISREEGLADTAAHSKDASCAVIRPGENPKIDLARFNLKTHSFRSPFHIDADMITYSKYALKLHAKLKFLFPQMIPNY